MSSSVFLIACLLLCLHLRVSDSNAISLSHKLRSRSRQHQHQHQHQHLHQHVNAWLDRVCVIQQGLSYRPDVHVAIGYMTELNLGGTAFPADLPGSNPVNNAAAPIALPAVMVLSHVAWSMKIEEPFTFTGVVSHSNFERINLIQKSPALKSRSVSFWWTVYGWEDKPVNKYFVSLSPSRTSPMNGVIESFHVDPTPVQHQGAGGPGPTTYTFKLSVLSPPVPAPLQQMLIATSTTSRIQQDWGVDVKAKPDPQ